MTNFRKICLAATGGLALAAVPATAQYYDRDDDGIGTEEVIAGAVILGGLAAILGGDDDDRYDRDDDYYYDDRYDGQYYRSNRTGYARELVERCVYAAENDARRYGQADVTGIDEVRRNGRYTRVAGDIRIAQTYSRDRYGRANYDREVDNGNFECYVDRRGRVVDVNYSDINDVRPYRR
tara:strand:- start:3309 stop:3848 length:540 start_codon:yes stop_codon:yes gene_type:complete